jgi:hypothetical protein
MKGYLVLLVLVVSVSACGGGSGGNYAVYPCAPGTNLYLARPRDGQSGVPAATTFIEIAGSGTNNNLYTAPQTFYLILVPQTGSSAPLTTAPLHLVSDPLGPFQGPGVEYYAGTLNTPLSARQVYLVFFNGTSSCTPESPIGAFAT